MTYKRYWWELKDENNKVIDSGPLGPVTVEEQSYFRFLMEAMIRKHTEFDDSKIDDGALVRFSVFDTTADENGNKDSATVFSTAATVHVWRETSIYVGEQG